MGPSHSPRRTPKAAVVRLAGEMWLAEDRDLSPHHPRAGICYGRRQESRPGGLLDGHPIRPCGCIGFPP